MADEDLQHHLESSVIARPLLDDLDRRERSEAIDEPLAVVIDLNADFREGQDAAADQVVELLYHSVEHFRPDAVRHRSGRQFLLADLRPHEIRGLADTDAAEARGDRTRRAIHRIWPDFAIAPLLDRTGATIKADAAKISYAARGRGIVWAVLDSGIQADHSHFAHYKNLSVDLPLAHRDFTGRGDPCVDVYGHGTHVAGIIAGLGRSTPETPVYAVRDHRDSYDNVTHDVEGITEIEGIAPETRLLSFKVLDENGSGRTGPILEALDEIQRINAYGRSIKIHGVNLSVGYEFDPVWFACGQSPICQEVDRLVRSGVVVVVAAGNTGYASARDSMKGRTVEAGRPLTINDPGNASRAITVGSTHRYMPYTYGVSYFSSKGPTGDGRAKPDIVAPGEKVLSAGAGSFLPSADTTPVHYVENTGTSMAAPHVSGALAAFLSIRPEFVGRPEDVKKIFLDSATDLGRVREFQGHGLLDIMRAIQSV